MPNTRPGIVIKVRFVDVSASTRSKGAKAFAGYIDYIDRSEAVRTQHVRDFSLYTDYMDDPQKQRERYGFDANADRSSALFTAAKDHLTPEEKQQYKKQFQQAFDHKNIMWQTVVSFDNAFLTELGLYDPATGWLNEARLRDGVRQMMKVQLAGEQMSDSAIWTASIHYNTDNIHIHIAMAEPENTRKTVTVDGEEQPRGRFKASTLKRQKSAFFHSILDTDYAKLDELVRKQMVGKKKEVSSFSDPKLEEMFLRIYHSLPQDKRKWYYSMKALDGVRPQIDQMSRYFLHTHCADAFGEFQRECLHEQQMYRRAYGGGSRYQDYSRNKMDDLYKRMGNCILNEMKEYARHEVKVKLSNQEALRIKAPLKEYIHYNRSNLSHSLSRLGAALAGEVLQRRLNLQAYYQLEQGLSIG